MRACKHGCESTRIFIGFVLSDARFDWLVGNIRLQRLLQRNPMFVSMNEIDEMYFHLMWKKWKVCCRLITILKISRHSLADYVKKLHQKACQTCRTIISGRRLTGYVKICTKKRAARSFFLIQPIKSLGSEFKIWRRQRQRQRHKSMIWLVQWRKISCCTCGRLFGAIFYRSLPTTSPQSETLSFFASTWKTIRAKQAKVHFA